MTIVTLLSSLPYLHEIITLKDGSLHTWIPDLGIQNFLADENGKFFKYSTYRKFLYSFFINLFIFFGWLGWFLRKTNKHYRYAILLPLLSSVYQILILLTSNRSSWLNAPEIKIIGTLIVGLALAYFYFKNRKIRLTSKLAIIWVAFLLVSFLPYLHDILTLRDGELRAWVPFLGIQDMLTGTEGRILGFNSYRVLLFFLMTHIFAQIGWVGYFFDSYNRINRPFILVPVIFSFYELTVILINISETKLNSPDWKLYATILIAIGLAINIYFFDKRKRYDIKYKALQKLTTSDLKQE